MGVDKISKEQLETYVNESTNWKELMIKCGYTNFNNRKTLTKRLELFNISISHFVKKTVIKKYSDEEIFCKDSKFSSTLGIKKRLINKYNIEYKCNKCGIKEWQGSYLILELDHINGDHFDNRLENLRFLCPNCHSQTDTFRGRNVKHDNHNSVCKCGNTKSRSATICIICKNYKNKDLDNINSIHANTNVDAKIYHYTNKNKCIDCNIIIQNVSSRCKKCFRENRKNKSKLKEKIKRTHKHCTECNKDIKTTISEVCMDCKNKSIIKKKCSKCNKTLKNNGNTLCYTCNYTDKPKSRKKCKKCSKPMRSIKSDICQQCDNNIKKCYICNNVVLSKKIDKCILCRNKDNIKNNIVSDTINEVIMPIENNIEKQEQPKNKNLTNNCKNCNTAIYSTSVYCVPCGKIVSRKVERPSYEQIIEDKKTMTFVAIGKKYDVSDNTIRKWIKYYEKQENISKQSK